MCTNTWDWKGCLLGVADATQHNRRPRRHGKYKSNQKNANDFGFGDPWFNNGLTNQFINGINTLGCFEIGPLLKTLGLNPSSSH
eukprot:1223891-Amphidinium_carterae.1